MQNAKTYSRKAVFFRLVIWATLIFVIQNLSIELQAQANPMINSLKSELKKSTSDSARIHILLELSSKLSGRDIEQSRSYAEQIIDDSAACSVDQMTGAYRYLAFSYFDEHEYNIALRYFLRAYRFARQQKDPNDALRTAESILDCYRYLGNYTEAFNTAFEAIPLAEADGNYLRMGHLFNRIGELYRDQDEAENAIEYLKKAYSAYEKADEEYGMLGSKVNLALAQKQKDPNQALHTYQEVISEFNHLFSSWDSARIFSNLANIYLDLDEFEVAEENLMNALDCHERIDQPISKGFCYKELGELYLRTNQPEKTVNYSGLAFEIGQQFDYHTLKFQSSKQLSDAHARLGNFKDAHKYLSAFVIYQDSVKNQEKIELSHELEAKYATEKKEQQIKIQEEQLARQQAEISQEEVLRNALITGLSLVMIIGVIVYRNARLQETKNREIQGFAEQVQELQETQSRWFTNIAHELRTPLTLILGPIQNLLRQKDLPQKAIPQIELAKKYGDQLVHRVNEILEISRLESGKLTIDQRPTDVVLLARQAIASFDSHATEKDVKLSFDSNQESITLNVDAKKIKTILDNLISNAIKFTPSGESVDIKILQNESIIIQVEDSGIGISDADLPHVFERFYQSKGQDQDAYGGSGVGLTLSQELAKMHGGEIRVSSAVDQGSIFSLVLPKNLISTVKETITTKVDFDDQTELEASSPAINGNRPKILLVEDHPDMRKYIRGLLEENYQIQEAANGVEGLDRLSECEPDLIISDVKMPEMDGLEFAQKVKSQSQFRLIPFINLTAHANERDKLTALKTGVDDYLHKPFDAEELKARVHNLINNAAERKRALKDMEGESAESLSHDEQVMTQLEEMVREKISDSAFNVSELAKQAAMSESSLSRHTKKMSGLTPGQFIRDIRLQQAIQYLERKQFSTVAEVVYAVGFEDVSSFSRLFKKRFGKSPSIYMQMSL